MKVKSFKHEKEKLIRCLNVNFLQRSLVKKKGEKMAEGWKKFGLPTSAFMMSFSNTMIAKFKLVNEL